jgi:hypothetical protein
LKYYKLFLVPFDGRRLFTHNHSFLPADRLQTFIEFTAICPTLLDFREGFTIRIKHTISTNVINITSVGHAAGCLNLENEVQSEAIPVDARRYVAKQFLREVHEYVTHSQERGVRRGKHGEFKNDTTDASELNEDDTLAISTALALYGHNIFSSLSAISANVIDIQLRNTELGQETIQRLLSTPRRRLVCKLYICSAIDCSSDRL